MVDRGLGEFCILEAVRVTSVTNRKATKLEDEDLLIAVLNSAPIVDGSPTDQLAVREGGELAKRLGGTGAKSELLHLQQTRDALQDIIRGDPDAADCLASALDKAVMLPEVTPDGIRWQLDAPVDERLSARVVLAWSHVVQQLPGRLRACANTECNLFLIDHSRPATAKWCSMTTCGNRIKARAHAQRARQGDRFGRSSSASASTPTGTLDSNR